MNGTPSACPVAVLISGRGSNLRALIAASRDAPYRVALVLSDKADAGGLAAARDAGVPARVLAPAAGIDRAGYDRRLADALDDSGPALIVLAGFMRILSTEFVERYAGRLLNIHPALLPKYPGLHTHRRVLEAGEREHGATVHFVTAALDAGPPVLQAHVDVGPDDDETTLAARVQALEHRIYPLAVRWFCEGRLLCRDGRAWLDGEALVRPIRYGEPPADGTAR